MKTAREKLIVAKNSFANLVRGGAGALVALFLPPFLTRSMSPAAYGAWALVLQLSAYVGYLDFGIQTAVGRFVARANELRDAQLRDQIVNTSFAILGVAGVLAIAAIVGFADLLPIFFHRLPVTFLHDVRIALVLVGGSLAVGLPASVFTGVFVGMQRHEIPAVIIGSSRLAGAVLVVAVVRHGGSLAEMGLAVAAVNLLSYAFQYFTNRRILPDMKLAIGMISKSAVVELVEYCSSLTAWSAALLLVTGLDLTIVGIYRFREVAYYAVAATVVTFIAGLYNAIFSPMVPATAVMHARENRLGLGKLVEITTRYGMFLLLTTGLPIIFWATPLLTVWVGAGYAIRARLLVQILVVANIIRLSTTPYIIAMIGSGQQRLIILTPLLEGITNLIVSVIGGYYLGALGVALGTLAGALVGVIGNIIYNMPRTEAIQVSIRSYILESLFRPLLCSAPVFGAAFLWHLNLKFLLWIRMGIIGFAGLLTLWMLWKVGLMPTERQSIMKWLRNAVS